MEEFNPDVVMWLSDKVRRLTAGPYKPKRKREEVASISYIDLDSIVMPDLEDEEDFVLPFLFISCTARFFCFTMCYTYSLQDQRKKKTGSLSKYFSVSSFSSVPDSKFLTGLDICF